MEIDDYPPEWYAGLIQARIRERASYTCEICGRVIDPVTNVAHGTEGDEVPIFGHVHHLDHYPPNCDDTNLIFLCQTCHIRLHGLGWKPGDELPLSWGNQPPHWIVKRQLPYRLNPAVTSWHESVKYRTTRQERAHAIIQLVEGEGWISGAGDPYTGMRELLRLALSEYEQLLEQRKLAAQQPTLAQAEAWAAERGYVPRETAIDQSGLSSDDFDLAVEQGLLQPESCPYQADPIPMYFDPAKLTLSPETVQIMWSKARLTRQQAANFLGTSIPIFERLRRKAGFRPIGSQRMPDGTFEPLYRKSDVIKLRT